MKRCQKGTGKKTVTVLNLRHVFFLWWPSEIEVGATPISPILPHFVFFIVQVKLEIWGLPAGNIRCPDGMDRLCHILSDPRGLAAVHEATSDIGPPCNLGSHWKSSDMARRSCRKTHPRAWGPHFSSSSRAGSCLSYAAVVLIPVNFPC